MGMRTTLRNAAKQLGLHHSTLYRASLRGELKPIAEEWGRQIFDFEDVKKWAQKRGAEK